MYPKFNIELGKVLTKKEVMIITSFLFNRHAKLLSVSSEHFFSYEGCEEYVEKSQEQLQKEAENKLNEMISNYQMQDAIDQSEIDALDLEITACDEQIKDAKQQAHPAPSAMYGRGK